MKIKGLVTFNCPDLNFWPEFTFGVDQQPVFFIHRYLNKKWLKVELHLFTGTDRPECFHTHPAWAIRVCLRGGYIEERHRRDFRSFRAGDIGIVRPTDCHRVDQLLCKRPALTLWIRFHKVAKTRLVGRGWRSWERRSNG